jgi:hypothetical protein
MDKGPYQAIVFDKFLERQHYCTAVNEEYGTPLAQVLSWDELKEMFPVKTALTEFTPVEASKAEVATAEGVEDGFQIVDGS